MLYDVVEDDGGGSGQLLSFLSDVQHSQQRQVDFTQKLNYYFFPCPPPPTRETSMDWEFFWARTDCVSNDVTQTLTARRWGREVKALKKKEMKKKKLICPRTYYCTILSNRNIDKKTSFYNIRRVLPPAASLFLLSLTSTTFPLLLKLRQPTHLSQHSLHWSQCPLPLLSPSNSSLLLSPLPPSPLLRSSSSSSSSSSSLFALSLSLSLPPSMAFLPLLLLLLSFFLSPPFLPSLLQPPRTPSFPLSFLLLLFKEAERAVQSRWKPASPLRRASTEPG